MFERWTEGARRVVAIAQDEAREHANDRIGVSHIFVGLLREHEGLGATALRNLDVSIERVRELFPPSEEKAPGGPLQLTPDAQRLTDLALREALSLGHNYIGTEHVLLGAIRTTDGGRVLTELGLEVEDVRNEVIKGLSGPLRRARAARTKARTAPRVESVPTHRDRPATYDALGRARLAEILADRLRMANESDHRGLGEGTAQSFLIHVHAKWGEGKSSFLNFLRQELERQPAPWIVVSFNAWEHQRLAPPWWWLMSALRRDGARALWRIDRTRAMTFLVRDSIWRLWNARAGWLPLVLAAALLLVAIQSGIFSGELSGTGKAATAIAAVVTLLLTGWGVARGLSHWLLLGSAPLGARFLQRVHDPLGLLKRRFGRIVSWLHSPVAVFIDDVDRCQADFVVSLLEGVQTLFVEHPVVYVISGDRTWVSESYARVYEDFAQAAREPGRPLGYLFLEKTFQIALDLPPITPIAQRDYWQHLIRQVDAGDELPDELSEDRGDVPRPVVPELRTAIDIERAIQSAPDEPRARNELLRAVSQRLATPELDLELEHFLEQFVPLVENNPRAMKRLVNAHGLDRARQVREGVALSEEQRMQHVLWTIVKLRWPLLAEHLAAHPKDADRLISGRVAGGPSLVAEVAADERVLAVFRGKVADVELNSAAIRAVARGGPAATTVGV